LFDVYLNYVQIIFVVFSNNDILYHKLENHFSKGKADLEARSSYFLLEAEAEALRVDTEAKVLKI
jgi:hypothetical protein